MAPTTLALAPVLGDGDVDLRSANQKREYAHSHGGVGWSPSVENVENSRKMTATIPRLLYVG